MGNGKWEMGNGKHVIAPPPVIPSAAEGPLVARNPASSAPPGRSARTGAVRHAREGVSPITALSTGMVPVGNDGAGDRVPHREMPVATEGAHREAPLPVEGGTGSWIDGKRWDRPRTTSIKDAGIQHRVWLTGHQPGND